MTDQSFPHSERLHTLACSSCGGSLAGVGRHRILNCRFCGSALILVDTDFMPRYLVPAIPKTAAVSAVRKLLDRPELPDRFAREAYLREGKLYYIPFYEFTARRMGTRTSVYETTRRDGTVDKKVDTAVHLNDFTRVFSSVTLDAWGLEDLTIVRNSGAYAKLPLHLFNEIEANRKGVVLAPAKTRDDILQRLREPKLLSAMTLDDQLEIAETRFSMVYYPVWAVKFMYDGRLYSAYVDGATGDLLRARAPESENRRVTSLLIVVGSVAFIFGKLFKVGALNTEEILQLLTLTLHPLVIVFWLLGLAGLLSALALGWNSFRYSFELWFFPDYVRRIPLGKPPQNFVEKVADGFHRFLGKLFEGLAPPKDYQERHVITAFGRLFADSSEGYRSYRLRR